MRMVVVAVAFALSVPSESAAHRLDEYLQATRVSLERDRIILELDLTPGANIASVIAPLVDRDGDNIISPIEARMYGQTVLANLTLELDGRPVALVLSRVEMPSIEEMRDGVGTIQMRSASTFEPLVAGRRQLFFRNNHQPPGSVYLVNALIPADADMRVAGQTRDWQQQAVRIEYDVGPRLPAQLLWVAVAAAALLTLMLLRRCRMALSY